MGRMKNRLEKEFQNHVGGNAANRLGGIIEFIGWIGAFIIVSALVTSITTESSIEKANMKKPFTVAFIRELDQRYQNDEISYSRMVELMNEQAQSYYEEKIEEAEEHFKKVITTSDYAGMKRVQGWDEVFRHLKQQ